MPPTPPPTQPEPYITKTAMKRKAGIEGRNDPTPSQRASFDVKPTYALESNWLGSTVAHELRVENGVESGDLTQGNQETPNHGNVVNDTHKQLGWLYP